jgi:hypothetical protein
MPSNIGQFCIGRFFNVNGEIGQCVENYERKFVNFGDSTMTIEFTNRSKQKFPLLNNFDEASYAEGMALFRSDLR